LQRTNGPGYGWLALNFRLLGPLEVDGDGGAALAIGTGRQRALFGLLILHANELVASDQLVEELWGESPPPTAHKMLHNQVSSLRQALGRNGRLETRGSSYKLNIAPGERDVDRFEALVARGRALTGADPEAAARTLRDALGMWRGPPLSDLAYESFAQAEIARLEERRWVAFEAWVDAELAMGRHADLVGELEAAVKEQPLRERLHGRLMLALYRCGRQAEALEAYRNARATLVEQIGVEPNAELRDLHQAILVQDPELHAPAPVSGSPLLAGRDEEFAELLELLDTGGLAIVSGPRGIGKTRLAQELAREAGRRGMTVHTAPPPAPDGGVLILDDASGDALDRAAGLARSMPVVVLREHPLAGDLPARRLTLGPLSREAVAVIARLYDATLAVDALAAQSGGVPAAVHRIAAEWARDRVVAAVGTSAGRATSERGELRSAERDLSGDLLRLQALDERARRYAGDAAPASAVCPFLGLATFDAAHAEYFFGRERLVAELVARLVGSPLLAVIGPSGSGKSSAVQAGLLPALAQGVLPGSERWSRALMRPGAHPHAELERALPAGRAVLVVDQFEEAFTVCRDGHERAAFLDALVELAEDREHAVQTVLAVRADFCGHCATDDRLARLVGANQVLVGPMRRDELRRAIEEPARRAGLTVEPALTDALIADTLDQPGGLPLLSAALLEQWRERDGRTLRRAAYERAGGVHGAVGRLAERAYTALGEPEQRAARSILLRLADAGEHGAAFVRRRIPRDEVDHDEPTANALDALVDGRLVTAHDDTLEVAHEALLREWPRLRDWLAEDADGRRLHQHLINAARDWQAADGDSGELYRGARLASTLDWAAGHGAELNELEREFLAASRAEAEDEAAHQRRTNRRLRALLAGLAGLLVLALAAGVVALNQRGEARDAALAADAQRLGVEAGNLDRLDQALLFARAAVDLDESPATQSSLLSVLQHPPAVLGAVDHVYGIYGAAISADGKLMAIGDDIGNVVVYDAATRQRLGPPYVIESGLIQNVRFSPGGDTLAVSYLDRSKPEEVSAVFDLIDPRTGERRLRLRLPPLDAPPDFVYADIHFLPDGELLVVPGYGGSPDGPAAPVYRVNATTGAITDRLQVGEHAPYLYSSESAAGHIFLTSMHDGTTWELDPDPLRVVRSWPFADEVAAVSPDGRILALADARGRLRVVDLESGRTEPFRRGHDGRILRMRFTTDGQTLITASANGRLLAWDVERRTIAQRFAGHSDAIDGLDMTGDGGTLITGSVDTRAILWDLGGDRRLDRRFAVGRPFRPQFAVRGIAVSPDGRTVAITHDDGAVDLVDTASLQRRRVLHAMESAALSVAFSPDGRLLAVTGNGGRVTLWDARTLAPAGELEGLGGDSSAVAFSPDGSLLAATELDPSSPLATRPLRIWEVRSRELSRFRGQSALGGVAFSPDGKLIAAAAGGHGTEVREVATGRPVEQLKTRDAPYAVAFSDGELLFVGQYDGRGQLFSTDDWRPVGRPLEGHTARITSAGFADGGRTLVTAAADGTARLWDVASQKPLGSPLELVPGTYASVAVSPDGSRAYAVSTRGEGISFELSREAWKRHACRVAGRELTRAEWEDALPGRPYRNVCD
jgi:WD40 repeat protein/DNA-binding SARP family transcriptional activator